MLEIALTLLTAMHLLTVDLAMMGPMVCLWLAWRGRHDELANDVGRKLLGLSVLSLLAAIALGGAAALVICQVQPHSYGEAFRALPRSRYEFGVVELIFSLICLVTAWRLVPQPEREPRRFWLSWSLMLLGGTNLVYHFPPLFVMLGVLSSRPESWGQTYRFTELLCDPEVVARTMHHLLAALAVTGGAVAWLGLRGGQPAIAWGGRISAAAVVLQLMSGLWLVSALPTLSQHALSGGDGLSAALFGTSLLTSFFVLPRLGAMALGNAERRHAQVTIGLLLAVVFFMTASRHRTRDLVLAAETQVSPQAAH